MRLGFIERVTLPLLGLHDVAAKIDTGARTSALHVSSTRPMPGHTADLARLLVVLAGAGPAARRTIEVEVDDWVVVRDTSGRRERRPVISTVLQLGTLQYPIRLGLTDRADMLYTLLVGRTALPPGALVDPHARHLLAAAVAPATGRLRTVPGPRKL